MCLFTQIKTSYSYDNKQLLLNYLLSTKNIIINIHIGYCMSIFGRILFYSNIVSTVMN